MVTSTALDGLAGGLHNSSNSFFLINSPSFTPVVDTDYDTNNDGVLELPATVEVVDSVAWLDRNATQDIAYGTNQLTQFNTSPGGATRFPGNTTQSANLIALPLILGIGVDYGIYLWSRMQEYLEAGDNVHDAYLKTMRVTGASIIFTGITLAIGVVTWVFSPLQFQADIGIMLTFMFFVNMLGAIILLPALAAWVVPGKETREKPAEHAG